MKIKNNEQRVINEKKNKDNNLKITNDMEA